MIIVRWLSRLEEGVTVAARSWTSPRVLLSILVQVGLLTTLGLTMLLTSCRSSTASASTTQLDLRIVTEKRVGPAAVEVSLRNESGQPTAGAAVTLRGEMNHGGMKPVIVQMRETAGGTYLADDFRFTMGGDWLLTVEAALPGGTKVERTFEVPGVAAG